MPDSQAATPASDEETGRAEWIAAVEQLIRDAEQWSAAKGWHPERQRKVVKDDPSGPYEVPQLWIATGGRVVFLDPTSRFLAGGKGIADLYLWPEMDAVMVPWMDDGWQIHLPTDRFEVDRLPWSQSGFERAVSRLVGA